MAIPSVVIQKKAIGLDVIIGIYTFNKVSLHRIKAYCPIPETKKFKMITQFLLKIMSDEASESLV
jgi:hypothetical protein